MSNIFSSVPTGHASIPRESSPLISPRDTTGPASNWRHTAHAQQQSAALTSLMGVVSESFSKQRSGADEGLGMHPFRVYPWVSDLMGTRDNVDDEGNVTDISWRTVLVRTGLVTDATWSLNNTATKQVDGAPVLYTTGLPSMNIGSDSIPFLNGDALTDFDSVIASVFNQGPNAPNFVYSGIVTDAIECDEDAITWIWVELCTQYALDYSILTAAIMKASTTPATCGWENYPYANPYIFPIATVDTRRFKADHYALINQIRSENIVLQPSGYYGKKGTVDIDYSTYGGRGVPKGAIVCNGQSSNKGLYASRIWFNHYDSAANFANTDYWTKIADLT